MADCSPRPGGVRPHAWACECLGFPLAGCLRWEVKRQTDFTKGVDEPFHFIWNIGKYRKYGTKLLDYIVLGIFILTILLFCTG